MKIFYIFLLLFTQDCLCSIYVDWSLDATPSNVIAFILDYSPPVGNPPAGTNLAGTVHQVVLNNTLPATDYTIFLSALLVDGTRRNISEKHIPSSPDPPILDSIETSSGDATISFFPPDGKDITFYIEYFPIDREEYANFVETRSSLVKLRGLDPSTTFRLRILSVFRGVPSLSSIDTSFSTKDVSSAEEFFTVKTLPPDLDLGTTTVSSTEYEYSKEAEENAVNPNLLPLVTLTSTPIPEYYSGEEGVSGLATDFTSAQVTTLAPVDTPVTENSENSIDTFAPTPAPTEEIKESQPADETTNYIPVDETTKATFTQSYEEYEGTDTNSIETPKKKLNMKVTRRPTTTTPASTTSLPQKTKFPTLSTTTDDYETYPNYEEKESTEETTTTASTAYTSTNAKKSEIESNDLDEEILKPVGRSSEKDEEQILFEEYGTPSAIHISKEGKMLRLDWDSEDESLCDAFILNYTLLTLSKPKTFSVATEESFALIKMYTDHKLQLRVHCMLAGALSKTWWAFRVADLSKPRSIDGLRVVRVETDEFYLGSIVVEWNWPVFHDFDLYDVTVTYAAGKGAKTDLEVTKEGPVTIEKLEPATEYIISVKNSSRELEIASEEKNVKSLTPPIISSTLYPGQISSTAININFGTSDPEQGQFTHYELEFTGNNKNISKKIGMEGERSLTFTKLIPGKTYHFALYTVFKGVRSRPVVSEVTTYVLNVRLRVPDDELLDVFGLELGSSILYKNITLKVSDPLKVDKLLPVVGKDYTMLFWDIENFADNDVRFRLSYIGTSNSGQKSERTVELTNTNHYRFDELDMDTYYTFTITVIMGKGDAEAESESEMVTVAMGRGARTTPTLQRHGTRELALHFENDHGMWHELNGQINNMAVIIIEDLELGGDQYELRSWFEVKNDDKWGAYRASKSDYSPFKRHTTKEATFIIGEDDCEQQRLDEPYCNGMLRANINYLAKLRAYTNEGIAMETSWISIQGAVDEDGEPAEEDAGLPCHFYLNGCPRKGSENNKGFWSSIVSALGFLGMMAII